MAYSLIFWMLAAICNAVMDTLEHHFSTSIFNHRKLKDKFWNPFISSWCAPYIRFTKYKLDAWHLFKSSMIVFQALSITFAWMYGPPLLNIWWYYIGFFIMLGITWNGTFNIFYNHILIKK